MKTQLIDKFIKMIVEENNINNRRFLYQLMTLTDANLTAIVKGETVDINRGDAAYRNQHVFKSGNGELTWVCSHGDFQGQHTSTHTLDNPLRLKVLSILKEVY